MSCALISHFFHIQLQDVEALPISIYRKLINQALNLGNLYRQGKFKFLDEDEEKEKLKGEYEIFKKIQHELKEK